MGYSIGTRTADGVQELDPTLFVLEDGLGGVAEIWPALGFNCIRWRVVPPTGGPAIEALYRDPSLFQGARPTRSGIPVLFPFPNRIRDGLFVWQGKTYRLPTNDPVQKNAIHGFACRRPWRVINQGTDKESAWLTGEFRCSIDDPESLALWPADHKIRLTIRLGRGTLRLEAEVSNPDSKPLPFGLGYHPYFRVPLTGGTADDCLIEVPAESYWVLEGNLPTGIKQRPESGRDLNRPRRFGDLSLDDVLGDLPRRPARLDGLIERGTVTDPRGGTLRVFCSESFREMVVFTPPHREAFCIEPYTCTTDAINLEQKGMDAGWRVLEPGQKWTGVVELWV